MPELPEVETTMLGLRPHVEGQQIQDMVLRRRDLRWPIPDAVQSLVGATVDSIARRAKYILMHTHTGTAIWHLGMSGSLRVTHTGAEPRLHDHVDWRLGNGMLLRFHDPRRFGCLTYQSLGAVHPLLRDLGPEPLSPAFSSDYLFDRTRRRAVPIKHWLMDQKSVVGVGNIYAAEALFAAGVRPTRRASRVTRDESERLVAAVKRILQHAIERGGTTLRDFVNPAGEPGYFEQELFVYGREGESCRRCAAQIRAARLGARQSLYCPVCQR